MKKNKKNKEFILPETCLLEVSGISKFGDYMAVTVNKEDNPSEHKIYVLDNKKIKPALSIGDKFIAKMQKRKESWFAKPIARTAKADEAEEIIYGIIIKKEGKYYLRPSEKTNYMDYLLDNTGGAKDGDYVKVALSGSRRFKEARIIKNFGKFDLNKATATLILEKYKIPHEFPETVIKETQNLPHYAKNKREDFTSVPLVTIDGEDAKDFDDAIYAKRMPEGFQLIVAIADVAFYVQSHTALDKEAYKRGNSVYLPNMVVPMLPEILCNGVCSLRPKEERAAIACIMEIDFQGKIKKYEFKRAVIKSAARLTYKEVQDALDGKKNEKVSTIYKSTLQPVFDAYLALNQARQKRGALNLETQELKIKIDKEGNIIGIEKEEHYISHQIVEEFMIAANVCAAKALKKSKLPTMYRIHEKPQEEKLTEIEPLLHNLKLKLPDMPALKPEHFNKIIEKCANQEGIGDLILRLQSQARYSPHNIGHFGLGLDDYAHFTSPIRRYADLLIHRALIKAYKMPDGGSLDDSMDTKIYEEIGDHLVETERRAVNAERDITARFVSSYLMPSIENIFEVKVAGISNAGVFVRIENIGAEGLIPMSSLPADNYILSEGNMELRGENEGLSFILGKNIKAKLKEASPITGGLIFRYMDPEYGENYIEKGSRIYKSPQKFHAKMKSKKTKEKKNKKEAKKIRKNKIKKSNSKKKKS